MAKPQRYQIRVEGHLNPNWSEWLDGMKINQEPGDLTLLYGPVRDQAALFGILIKVRDMGLNLISVNRVETPDQENS
jgi:hypothetical protein